MNTDKRTPIWKRALNPKCQSYNISKNLIYINEVFGRPRSIYGLRKYSYLWKDLSKFDKYVVISRMITENKVLIHESDLGIIRNNLGNVWYYILVRENLWAFRKCLYSLHKEIRIDLINRRSKYNEVSNLTEKTKNELKRYINSKFDNEQS